MKIYVTRLLGNLSEEPHCARKEFEINRNVEDFPINAGDILRLSAHPFEKITVQNITGDEVIAIPCQRYGDDVAAKIEMAKSLGWEILR